MSQSGERAAHIWTPERVTLHLSIAGSAASSLNANFFGFADYSSLMTSLKKKKNSNISTAEGGGKVAVSITRISIYILPLQQTDDVRQTSLHLPLNRKKKQLTWRQMTTTQVVYKHTKYIQTEMCENTVHDSCTRNGPRIERATSRHQRTPYWWRRWCNGVKVLPNVRTHKLA